MPALKTMLPSGPESEESESEESESEESESEGDETGTDGSEEGEAGADGSAGAEASAEGSAEADATTAGAEVCGADSLPASYTAIACRASAPLPSPCENKETEVMITATAAHEKISTLGGILLAPSRFVLFSVFPVSCNAGLADALRSGSTRPSRLFCLNVLIINYPLAFKSPAFNAAVL